MLVQHYPECIVQFAKVPKATQPKWRVSRAFGCWAPVVCGAQGITYVGGPQNYGPFLGLYYSTAPNIYLGYPKFKGTIILTTTHIRNFVTFIPGKLRVSAGNYFYGNLSVLMI